MADWWENPDIGDESLSPGLSDEDLYPMPLWAPEDRARALANIRTMMDEQLRDLADSLSEGLADLPPDMQDSYWWMRAELARRAGEAPQSPPGS